MKLKEYIVFPLNAFPEEDELRIISLLRIDTESTSSMELLNLIQQWDERYGVKLLHWSLLQLYLERIPKEKEELFTEFLSLNAYYPGDGPEEVKAAFEDALPLITIDPKAISY